MYLKHEIIIKMGSFIIIALINPISLSSSSQVLLEDVSGTSSYQLKADCTVVFSMVVVGRRVFQSQELKPNKNKKFWKLIGVFSISWEV